MAIGQEEPQGICKKKKGVGLAKGKVKPIKQHQHR